MAKERRRFIGFVLFVITAVSVYTLLYAWGMWLFEGQSRSLIHALSIVVQTFTTTGYGQDAGAWTTWQMHLLTISMQLTGVFVIFLTLPLFVAPWVERRLRTSVPTSVDFSDHIVLCEITTRGETLIDELSSWEQPYVVVEPNRERAVELRESGVEVVHGDPESTETLSDINVDRAKAVVVDASDDRNASIVLSTREVSDDVHIIAFVEDPEMVEYLRYAGSDTVFTPRRLLGQSLANEVTMAVSAELGDTVEIGADLELMEVSIQSGSQLASRKLEDSGIRELTGANVLGLWKRGEFTATLEPSIELDEDTTLFVSGTEAELARLNDICREEGHPGSRGTVLIAGYGEVGSTVEEAIATTGLETVVIDIEEKSGVDVVGDATDRETLQTAGIGGGGQLDPRPSRRHIDPPVDAGRQGIERGRSDRCPHR